VSDVCAEMDASAEGSERRDVCGPVARFGCFGGMEDLYMEDHVAYFAIMDAAGTCQPDPDPVRWFGWGIFTEDGDLDYYAYATNEAVALTIARDAGCEGDLSAVLDVDNVGAGTCQEVA